jgi:hypothetical protein
LFVVSWIISWQTCRLAAVLLFLDFVLLGLVSDNGFHSTVVDCNATSEENVDILTCTVTCANKAGKASGVGIVGLSVVNDERIRGR